MDVIANLPVPQTAGLQPGTAVPVAGPPGAFAAMLAQAGLAGVPEPVPGQATSSDSPAAPADMPSGTQTQGIDPTAVLGATTLPMPPAPSLPTDAQRAASATDASARGAPIATSAAPVAGTAARPVTGAAPLENATVAVVPDPPRPRATLPGTEPTARLAATAEAPARPPAQPVVLDAAEAAVPAAGQATPPRRPADRMPIHQTPGERGTAATDTTLDTLALERRQSLLPPDVGFAETAMQPQGLASMDAAARDGAPVAAAQPAMPTPTLAASPPDHTAPSATPALPVTESLVPPSIDAAGATTVVAPPPTRDTPAADAPAPAATPPSGTPARQIAPVVVSVAIAGGTARLSVTLEPAELGRVEISVERHGDTAEVRVIAERPETLALIQRDQRELDRALTQAGISADGRGLSFSLSDGGGGAFASGGDGRGRMARGVPDGGAGADPSPVAAASPRRLLSLLDLAV